MAFSMSPPASINAARQSAKPALVRSRNSFTSCAGILLLFGVGCVLIRALFSLLFDDVHGGTGISSARSHGLRDYLHARRYYPLPVRFCCVGGDSRFGSFRRLHRSIDERL